MLAFCIDIYLLLQFRSSLAPMRKFWSNSVQITSAFVTCFRHIGKRWPMSKTSTDMYGINKVYTLCINHDPYANVDFYGKNGALAHVCSAKIKDVQSWGISLPSIFDNIAFVSALFSQELFALSVYFSRTLLYWIPLIPSLSFYITHPAIVLMSTANLRRGNWQGSMCVRHLIPVALTASVIYHNPAPPHPGGEENASTLGVLPLLSERLVL